MSQEKVDQYKKEKANRQKIMKREKMKNRLGLLAAAVIIIGLLGWFSVSVYQNSVASAAKSVDTVTLDTSDINAYMNEISTESAAE